MRFVRVTALAVLPSLALFSTTAFAANSCWYPDEAKAAQLRDFHSMLMVGTLQCRSSNKSAVDHYNEFVTKQRSILDAHASVLKAHFVRENGSEVGQSAYDEYATSLANIHSKKSVDSDSCATVDTFLRLATEASQPDLLILAQSLSASPESGACPSTDVAANEPSAPATAVEAKPAIAESTPQTEPVATAATEVAAPVTPEATVPSATTAATVTTAPAPASREDALQAAVTALQAAAVALQAASTSPAPVEKPMQTAAAVKVEDAPIVPPKAETTP